MVFVVPLDDDAVMEAATLAFRLQEVVPAQSDYRARRVSKGLRNANRRGAQFAVFRGPVERSVGAWRVKDLASGVETLVREDFVVRSFRLGT